MSDRRPLILHKLHRHPGQWSQQTRQYPPADLRNEEIQKTVVINPYWEKMNASDIDGDGDDDADDGDDDEHGN